MEEVVLMADFGCDTCLWAPGLITTDEYDHLLSEPLLARLREWYVVYERDCYLRRHQWVTDEAELAWIAEGNALVDLLNEELGPHGYEVFAGFGRLPWSAEMTERFRRFRDG